jgi:hypothetical protein
VDRSGRGSVIARKLCVNAWVVQKLACSLTLTLGKFQWNLAAAVVYASWEVSLEQAGRRLIAMLLTRQGLTVLPALLAACALFGRSEAAKADLISTFTVIPGTINAGQQSTLDLNLTVTNPPVFALWGTPAA